MALPCVTVAGLNAVPPPLLGKAAGTMNTLQQFGTVFGVAIVTAVFNSQGSLADPAAVTSGYRPALGSRPGCRCWERPWPRECADAASKWGRWDSNPHWQDPKSCASAIGLRPLTG